MGALALKGSTSGQVTIQAPSVAGTSVLTAPAVTGNIITSADSGTVTQTMLASNVAGNGPAFSAYLNTSQTLTVNTVTKLQIATKEFDTNSTYDTSLYRYTPGVAGIYQVNGLFFGQGTSVTSAYGYIYKNGSPWQIGSVGYANATVNEASQVSLLMQLTATDYIELWGIVNASSGASAPAPSSGVQTRFSAVLIRSA